MEKEKVAPEIRTSDRPNKGVHGPRFGDMVETIPGSKNPNKLDHSTGIARDSRQMEQSTSSLQSIGASAPLNPTRTKSVFSSISKASSVSTIKKKEVELKKQQELDELEEKEDQLKDKFREKELEVLNKQNRIESLQEELKAWEPKDGETADESTNRRMDAISSDIRTCRIERKDLELELQKLEMVTNRQLKSIERKKRNIEQIADLDLDKLSLEDNDHNENEDIGQIKDLCGDWLEKQTPNAEDEFMIETQIQSEEAERLQQQLEEENQIAQERANKANEDLKLLAAEEALHQQALRKAQEKIDAKRQQLKREAVAAEQVVLQNRQKAEALRNFPQQQSTSTPSSESMMCKLLEMQMKLMENGQLNPRTNSTSHFLARQSHAKDLPFFGGKPEEWPTFIAEYERSSRDCAFSQSENMSRLRKCLKGEAIRTVQCLMVAPENIDKVLKTLKDRFGQPEHIIEAMICKARAVPAIKEDKLETLIEFGNSVQNVTMSIIALKCDDHLNNPQLLRELESKLPAQMRMDWMRWIKIDTHRKKNLTFFSEWLEEETTLACQLCPPKIEKEEKKAPTEQYRRRRPGETVLATSSNDDKGNKNFQNSSKGPSKPREKKCAFCSDIGHRIAQCKEYEKESLDNKWKVVKDKKLCFGCLIFGHDVKACRSKKVCGIGNCDNHHNRLLHKPKSNAEESVSSEGSDAGIVAHAANVDQDFQNCHILPVRLQGPKGIIKTYAMMDNGANVTLIKSSVAEQLGLKGVRKPLRFQGLHPIAEEVDSCSVELNIMPATGKAVFGMSGVRTIRDLPLPRQSIHLNSITKWKHLKGLGIKAYSNAQPDILIGNDHFKIMVTREVREGPPNAPVAVKTNLGWTLLSLGNVPDRAQHSFLCYKDDLHQIVKDYFTTDSFGVKINSELPRSKEDKRAQSVMDLTMKRVGPLKKRWETGLLWKADNVQLPESKQRALSRLWTIEKKLDRDPKYAAQYCEKMQHYFDKGFAEKLSPEEARQEGPRTWYLPHFSTSKPSKPDKIRLVFDAAARSNGICLNDTLLKGEDQVNPLPSVLFKFRQRAVGITGDIREMFHQVNVRNEDQDSLRFLWRGTERESEPEVYRMKVMVFGAACSPACAQEAKNRNAKEHFDKYPDAANAIIYKHFVDDYLDSLDTEEEAYKIIQDVVYVHLQGGFEIVNFISNSSLVMTKLPEDLRAAKPKIIDPDSKHTERVLGLNWDPVSDQFTFTINFYRVAKDIISGNRIPTKREALSLIMSVYDPLGFLAHLTIKAKILLQETWRSEVGWDTKIPVNTHEKWLRWITELQEISTFRLPRCYDVGFSRSESRQLHVFCDASEQAFAAVAYYRIKTSKGIKVAFVSAKARVAPLKTLCMPRMELQAAVLGTRLANSIKEQHEIQPTETHYWTDSEVAYCWVKSDGKRYPQFVSHRVGEIQESSNAEEWHWVPTKQNVADEATRDNCPTEWGPESRWVQGPDFLLLPESEWPKKATKEILQEVDTSKLEMKKEFVGAIAEREPWINIADYSSWNKLRRVVAWIFRYVRNLKNREKQQHECLLYSELMRAEKWLWKKSQEESFANEISILKKGGEIPRTSVIKTLNPFLEEEGVLKVLGRLDKAKTVCRTVRNSVILHPKNDLTKLIIRYYHEEAGHQGQERVVNELRQIYCIPHIRTAVRNAWNHCQQCKNGRSVPVIPQMGLIPECRLQSYVRPFTVTGLDYFGPIEVTVGRRHEKRYGALFTCLTCRAVHVEIASSLTTDSCIMAIRRFAARRGNPLKLYSDNGTNFKGADNELKAALKEIDQDKMINKMTNLGIEWNFIPPGAPHMGGCWERLVKSIKTALKGTLNGRFPKDELLQTLIAEAEHVVNSRPLTHVSHDPEDDEALTPNHFLIGTTSNMQPPGDFTERDICIRTQWRAAQALTNQFWRRWVKEYLPTLTRRTKWHKVTKPIEVGDIVLIADNNMTRNSWPMGKVVNVYPGRDGQVRVVDVKTANNSVYNRPVSKICVLDVRKTDENAAASSSGASVSASTTK